MSFLLVGGDRLGKIKENLKASGATKIKHVTGRKREQTFIDLPDQLDVVLVFTDFINHGLATKIKKSAHKKGIKILYSKRSWSHVAKVLEEIHMMPKATNLNFHVDAKCN